MNGFESLEKDFDRQLLQSSLQYGLISTCFRYAWIVCLIAVFATVIWFPFYHPTLEDLGLVLLIIHYLAVQRFVLPKINSIKQFDFISLICITPLWLLCIVTVMASKTEDSLPTVAIITAIASLLFYRDRLFWGWLTAMLALYVVARFYVDKPMTRIDWITVLLVLPTISLLIRSTVNSSYSNLVRQNEHRMQLVSRLSQTIDQLRHQESIARKSKLEIEASTAQLHAIVESAPLFLCCIDENERFSELRGNVFRQKFEDPSCFIGEHYKKIFHDWDKLVEAIEQSKVQGSCNVRTICPDDNVYEIRIVQMLDSDGSCRGLIVVGVDITESVLNDQQRLELQQSLLHVQKMESLGLLAGGVAHDFNNYLMAIVAFADSMSIRGIEDVSVEKIKETALQASGICEQLLVYSGKQSPNQTQKKLLTLSQLVESIRPLIHVIVPKNITLKIEFDSAASSVNVIEGQIHQIMVNMVKNSVEAIEDFSNGQIRINTISRFSKNYEAQFFGEFDKEAEYCALAIADNGAGIEADSLGKIADLYFSTKTNGHGFGMAVAARLVKDHGGCLEVEAQPGSGTIIRIVLPVHGKQVVEDTVSGHAEVSKKITGYQILLVDDEPAVVEALQLVLKSQGHSVIAARSASEALELLEKHGDAIDCIVSDFSMPRMNGLKFGERIRNEGRNQPFVLCSGYCLQTDLQENDFKPDLVLLKPFNPKSLDEGIRMVCESSKQVSRPKNACA